MRPLSSIALRFVPHEDRLLLTIDAGSACAYGYWLTRRLALNVIRGANSYLDRSSSVMSKTPMDLRGELALMEREIAIASTQEKVSYTSSAAQDNASVTAELAAELSISGEPSGFRLKFRGHKGGAAEVRCSRAELQRIIHMLEQEAANAGWREGLAVTPPSIDGREARRRAH